MNLKILITSLILVGVIGKASSQKLQWGVKGGLNMSTIKSDFPDEKFTPGFHVGGLAEIKISEKWFVQPELFYSQEGTKVAIRYTDGTIAYTTTNRIHLGYIQLPVMIKRMVYKKLSVQAGPQIGYLVSAKNKYSLHYEISGEALDESGTQDIKEDFKELSMGLNFGMGYEFKNKLFLEALYHYGMININKNSDEGGVTGNITNQGFQFSVGYKF